MFRFISSQYRYPASQSTSRVNAVRYNEVGARSRLAAILSIVDSVLSIAMSVWTIIELTGVTSSPGDYSPGPNDMGREL